VFAILSGILLKLIMVAPTDMPVDCLSKPILTSPHWVSAVPPLPGDLTKAYTKMVVVPYWLVIWHEDSGKWNGVVV
jgi:hypothetical protein